MKYVLDASVPACSPLKPSDCAMNTSGKSMNCSLPPSSSMKWPAALTKAERQKDIAVGQAAPLYAKVMNSPPVLIAHAPLIARAIDISSRTRSGYYDCLYVALAEREGCQLITADQKSVNNLAPHFSFIVPLATLP